MPSSLASPTHTRVPEVTVAFWLIKVLTTGVGETSSDFMVKAFDPAIVVLLCAAAFAACFLVQFEARRYVPWRYRLFVTVVAIFGTMVADVTHILLGLPYAVSTPAFAILVTGILITWWRVEGTLSVHSVTTGRRELFYWATVLATFALGTAFGDLTATTLGLGYLGSGLLFAALIAVPAIGFRLGLGAITAFWAAYIVTRPLGASFADWLAVSTARGGLDVGALTVSTVGLAAIAAVVAALQRSVGRGQSPWVVASDAPEECDLIAVEV